ncbi:transposase family protein [Kitasatospora purpeofusca]|uniref:transposase family protein n=1 Tax=Kitasatospora purpeofusca TaxID=67352 RepID=UPI00225B94A7|nr:transposase family protein [Kitasatospora purpeofusca]MCX4690550.1 transposase family protein [Kitasatospora purpeofusca]
MRRPRSCCTPTPEQPRQGPHCSRTSGRVHGRYVRRLADAAIGGKPVVVELLVRRFRCLNGACTAVTFVEQIEGLTTPTDLGSSG